MRNNSKRNFISKRPTAFIRVQSVIFSLIKAEEIIRSLSCKNPFCAIVKGLRFSKASKEQIPTAMSEETTKRVNCHKYGNLPLFYIEKDTRNGVLYAPFACVLMPQMDGFEVLQALNEKQYIKEIPVVVISTENDVAFVRRAYELGATDYISRPFNAIVIQHRVKNTLMIYSNQKKIG